mgnify:CR=1 FL=1
MKNSPYKLYRSSRTHPLDPPLYGIDNLYTHLITLVHFISILRSTPTIPGKWHVFPGCSTPQPKAFEIAEDCISSQYILPPNPPEGGLKNHNNNVLQNNKSQKKINMF